MSARPLAEDLKMTRPFHLPEVEAFLNVVRTADRLQHDLAQVVKPHGITLQQYNVLRILRGAGKTGLPCLEVAGRMVTRVPDITRLIDRMVRGGLVERERSTADRRVVNVRVTAKGRRVADELEDPIDARHRDQLGHLRPEELRRLNDLLERAREGLED